MIRTPEGTKKGTSYAYAYDDLGNLTTHAGETQEYDLIRPHAITRRDITATIPTVYSYDDDGNVESIVGDSTTQYFEFDSANQAVCLSRSSSSCDTRVAYDVSGKRIAEFTAANQHYRAYVGETFLYEALGLNPKASVEVMLDGKRIALKRFDPRVRVVVTAGAWVVYLPPPSWIAGGLAGTSLWLVILGLRNGTLVLVRRRPFRAATAFAAAISLFIPSVTLAGGAGAADPPTYFWEISDPLGTGMVMLDSNGDRVRHQVFTPFGAMHDETGANLRTFYAGHRRDEASGMFYMQARWYDPGAGRFLSTDPLIRSTATPQSANAYSYGENNPVNGTDPTGEAWVTGCGGGCTNYHFTYSSYLGAGGTPIGEMGYSNSPTTFFAGGGGFGEAAAGAPSSAAASAPSETAAASTSASDPSPADRQAVFDAANSGRGEQAGQQEFEFKNEYASAIFDSDGNIDSRTLHPTSQEARDAPGQHILGETRIGSKSSIIYGGATHGGLYDVTAISRKGLSLSRAVDFSPVQHATFVMFHEFQHGQGVRAEGAADAGAWRMIRAGGLYP